jgi:hypothetical protein
MQTFLLHKKDATTNPYIYLFILRKSPRIHLTVLSQLRLKFPVVSHAINADIGYALHHQIRIQTPKILLRLRFGEFFLYAPSTLNISSNKKNVLGRTGDM